MGTPDLRLLVVPPMRSDSLEELKAASSVLTLPSASTCRELKQAVVAHFQERREQVGLTPCDLTLYFQNKEGRHSKALELLEELGSPLSDQGVLGGALVVCQLAAWDRPTTKLGSSTYYMWAAEQEELPESLRIQPGGEPKKLREATPDLLVSSIPIRMIQNYRWQDESRRRVKLYIGETEQEAVNAASVADAAATTTAATAATAVTAATAATGASGAATAATAALFGRLRVTFTPESLEVRVNGETTTYLLSIQHLEHRIKPELCSYKLAPNKRITITLEKEKEDSLWNTLYKLH